MFNGTVGIVTALSTDDQSLTVRTDEDELIDYDFDELDELAYAYAYAMTIHRSHASEYPAVVIPVTTSCQGGDHRAAPGTARLLRSVP